MTQKSGNVACPGDEQAASHFEMINVAGKRPTTRYAIAGGTISLGQTAFAAVRDKTLPKGDVLALAESAGIMGAKKTPDFVPMCHHVPLDQVRVHFEPDESQAAIIVYAQATAFAKTGVEMEALNAVQAALMTIWDLTKGIEADLAIHDVRLLAKTGGKQGIWTSAQGIPDWLVEALPKNNRLAGLSAGVIVMSDRATSGESDDESGPVIVEALKSEGANLSDYTLIPDDYETIKTTLHQHCRDHAPDILIASGGTGPGPRDVSPEAMEAVCDRMLVGLGELLRHESLYYTDTAWLSRMTAGILGGTLVIAFPGSPGAVQQCWDVIVPFLGDAVQKIRKQGYERIS